ncbi:MAG: ATP-dependent protease ATPase subunit HslU [Armatimonadetes bacterium]|nr:ATP-dependent protease ATPase subunit HslU [Armatimonadota bacterium]
MDLAELTPRQIVAELDKYIVGQAAAKRAVAVALRNRHRRRQLPDDLREEVIPKNILMIGPTGVGKTEIARRLARLANAPFVKVEATKFTEVGYVGRDVDSIIRDLVQRAYQMVEEEHTARVRDRAEENAIDRIVEALQPGSHQAETRDYAGVPGPFGFLFPRPGSSPPPPLTAEEEERQRRREQQRARVTADLRAQIASGALDDQMVEVEVEESPGISFLPAFSQSGMEEIGVNLADMFGNVMPKRRSRRRMTIREAREVLTQEEARQLIDLDAVKREALERAQQSGIVFVDELDKIAGRDGGVGPDVSRGGVQRDLLPIIEGTTVQTKFGPTRTDHILFIAAGAFHVSKPSDLMPELQGRLPIRVELESLTEADFRRILTEPQNALTRQYAALLAADGVALRFTEDGIATLASVAAEVNAKTENIGARRLYTVMEKVLEDVSFAAPDEVTGEVVVDAAYVRVRLEKIAADQDLARYVL